MKKISFFLPLLLIACVFSGCTGTPVVYYSDCTCPAGTHDASVQTTTPTEPVGIDADAVMTGLYIATDISGSKSATAEEDGDANYDVTVVAVTVDGSGVIRDCIIDSLGASVSFDASGTITSDPTASILTKNELGENYGMKAASGIGREWNEQAAALADYAVGKTAEQLRTGAVSETGKAADADLSSSATIYLGGLVSAIEEAAANAQYLGARSGDALRLAIIPKVDGSKSTEGENPGIAQLDADVTALTMNGDVITSCYIDSLQAKISFDTNGTITTDLTAPVLTKNQLGENYGMKASSTIGSEWNEQAAAFARYVTGKTAAEVAGIAVSEGKAAEADLQSSVTVSVGGFQELIAKAAQE